MKGQGCCLISNDVLLSANNLFPGGRGRAGMSPTHHRMFEEREGGKRITALTSNDEGDQR